MKANFICLLILPTLVLFFLCHLYNIVCFSFFITVCVRWCVQVHVLQEQLSVEVCARTEAQTRVQRLLQQNTDLLQHISLLVKQIQELELKAAGQLTSSEWKSAFMFT